jgi:hypothetical protein
MRLSSMFFALLLSPFALSAQQATGNTASPAIPNDQPRLVDKSPMDPQRQQMLQSLLAQARARAASACPVGFSVNRRANGAVIWTVLGQPTFRSQGVDITFVRPSTKIVSADIVVHGYPPTVQAIPATPSAPSEVTQTFHLTANDDQPLLHSSVWTEHMTAISWVELTRLDYANGTSWQPSAAGQCRATPSLYLLVNSAR